MQGNKRFQGHKHTKETKNILRNRQLRRWEEYRMGETRTMLINTPWPTETPEFKSWEEKKKIREQRAKDGKCIHDEKIPLIDSTLCTRVVDKSLEIFCSTCEKVFKVEIL